MLRLLPLLLLQLPLPEVQDRGQAPLGPGLLQVRLALAPSAPAMPGGWRNLELQPHSKRVRVRAAQASDARGGPTPRAAAAAGPAARDVARGWGAATSRHAALDAQLLVAPAAPLAADHGRAPHAAQARGGGGAEAPQTA